MQVRPIKYCQLSAEQISVWSRLQAADASLDSPFFHPQFTQQVAAVLEDVEVAEILVDGSTVGFLPYHRDRNDVGLPLGRYLSDFQGVILAPGVTLDPNRLVDGCGLRAFHFNHLLTSQSCFHPFHWLTAPSPYMDLSQGYDHYTATRANSDSDELKQVARHVRKISRELGPIRVEPFCDDLAVLKTLIDWKVEQYRKLKTVNYLAPRWVVTLLKSLINSRNDALRGMLSTLYIGDRVAAIHLGVRSNGVLHSWIPAYDVELSKYSPGAVLLIELARLAPSLGIRRIDLGKGPEPYKQRFMTAATPVAEGAIDLRPLHNAFSKTWRCTRELVRSSPLRSPAQYLVRSARAWIVAHQFRESNQETASSHGRQVSAR